MSQTESGPDSLNDADMDALLKEFFENEMPAALRQASAAPRLVSVRTAAHKQERRPAGWLGLSVVAGSLLTVTILLSQPSSQSPIGSAPEGPVASSPELKPEANGLAAADATNSVEQITPDIEIYDTANGPVEQRSKFRIKSVLFPDPDTGAEIEMLLPELEIEIFPIDDDEKDSLDGKGKGADFRFQLQPKIEGAKRHLYLRLQWLGAGQKVVRTLELDLGTELNIEQLLDTEPLKKELKQLPPKIRKRLESVLRKAQIPASNVKQ